MGGLKPWEGHWLARASQFFKCKKSIIAISGCHVMTNALRLEGATLTEYNGAPFDDGTVARPMSEQVTGDLGGKRGTDKLASLFQYSYPSCRNCLACSHVPAFPAALFPHC